MAVVTITMSPSFDTRETRAFAFEIKFLLPAATAERVRHWARARLGADPHGTGAWSDEYLTTSIYFDTPAFDVYRQRGSYGRMKFRVRRYASGDEIHLERKLRNSRMLSKRRTTIDYADLSSLETLSLLPQHPCGWFHRRLSVRGLQPVAQVSYVRTARVADSAYGPIRLTVDDQIRAAATSSLAFADEPGTAVLDGYQILELKYRFAMPAIFKHLVEHFALTPMTVSKYRLSAAVVLPVGDPGRGTPRLPLPHVPSRTIALR